MTKSDAAILMEFFGRKRGESIQEFGAELKALTSEDKAELVAMILARGEVPLAA